MEEKTYALIKFTFISGALLSGIVFLTIGISFAFNSDNSAFFLLNMSLPLLVCLVCIPILINKGNLQFFRIPKKQWIATAVIYLLVLPFVTVYIGHEISYLYVIHLMVISLAEEFYCRGVLNSKLQKHFSELVALLFSSLIFALVFHFDESLWQNLLLRFPLGLLLGVLYNKTRNLYIPIVVHTIYNSLVILL